MSDADIDVERLAAEFAEALRPVLQDVLVGRTRPETMADLQTAAIKILGKHLALANAALIIADLRALAGIPGRVVRWFLEHPCATDDEPTEVVYVPNDDPRVEEG